MSASASVLAKTTIWARVYEQLRDIVNAGDFWKIATHPQTGEPSAPKTEENRALPNGFAAQEVGATFSASRTRRTNRLDRSEIAWEAVIEFPSAVITEDFELAVCDLAYTAIPASGEIPELVLRFDSAQYGHPVMQGGSTGSKIKYAVTVIPSPR